VGGRRFSEFGVEKAQSMDRQMNLNTQRAENGDAILYNPNWNLDPVAKTRTGSMDRIRVLVVDEHILFRAGIRSLLERLRGVEVIAEARDGQEALNLAAKYEPQIVMMGLEMPNMNGLEVTERLAQSHPNVKVIILSTNLEAENLGQALRAGVAGYVFQGTSMKELEVAISSVAQGETYLSPQVTEAISAQCLRRTSARHQAEILTCRQRQVLQLIAEGKNTKQIALILNIGAKTVETHRANLMERLDIHDVAGLVRYAIRTGLATVD
jgi:DNA-binding NarL/FixJ family response regulator